MNRRRFLRSAAVATVSVPVLQLPFGLGALSAPGVPRAPLVRPASPIVYVSMTGDDSAAGTSQAPVRRIQEAVNRIKEQLPVELLSFEVMADGAALIFRWATASETNNAGFYIEHQARQAWAEIAFVAGRGTTPEAQAYVYRVDAFRSGSHRFRLRQVDHDGAVSYSSVLEVSVRSEGVRIMPNPARDAIRVEGLEPDVPVLLYDALGRRVMQVVPESPVSTIDVSGLPRGMYFIRTRNGSYSFHLI